MNTILERVKRSPLPAAAAHYEQGGLLRLLVVPCRELQCSAGNKEFFLSTRTAAGLLGLITPKGQPDHVIAWRWLFLSTQQGVVEPVEKGDRATRKATRFRYLGD
jgi:hypothetical protein